jgi:Ala-tRNA(Pro) deacylase
MIPERIVQYLREVRIPFTRRWHAKAVTAQELAASLHVTGFRVAKSVLLDVDGQRWIAVLPAPERVDTERLAEALDARHVRLLDEPEFDGLFPECELGAEPPFGRLYGLPVVVDTSLAGEDWIIFRAGSHEETIAMAYEDFARLEQPKIANFGVPAGRRAQAWEEARV